MENLPAKMKEIYGEALIDNREAFLEIIPQSTDSFLQVIKEEGKVVASWRADGAGNSTARDSSVSNIANSTLRQIVLLELKDARMRKFYTFPDASDLLLYRRWAANGK